MQEISEHQIGDCIATDRLRLILLPTEACNFRCVYCYEEFKHGRMKTAVVRGVKRLLSRSASRLKSLELTWFGGEPLLARDIVEEIMGHARGLSRRNPGLRYESDLTTNASLLSVSVFERLHDLGLTRCQISFDGPRAWHDRKRVLANGRGTFDLVWRNMLALRGIPREFSVLVRLHVDRENQPSIPDFIRQYQAEFGNDSRFRLHMCALGRLGGPNDPDLPVLTSAEKEASLRSLHACAEEHQAAYVEESDFPPICHAVEKNTFVVRANGRLNKCTVALDHPMNQIGRIHEDGSLEIDEPTRQRWMRGLHSGQPLELECPAKGLAGR